MGITAEERRHVIDSFNRVRARQGQEAHAKRALAAAD
jgi:hypothetical protein